MDWNNDGKTDLISGDTKGNVWLFLNTGTKERPELAEAKRVEADGKPIAAAGRTYQKVGGKMKVKTTEGSHKLAEVYTKVHMADWDGDGLKDLLVGHRSTVILYKNVGTQSAPRFQAPTLIKIAEGKFPDRPAPYVIDWDGDGKKDLLVGTEKPTFYFYQNVGTEKAPQLAAGKVLEFKAPGFEGGSRCRIEVTDWNNDGKRDVLIGNMSRRKPGTRPSLGGNIWLFLGK